MMPATEEHYVITVEIKRIRKPAETSGYAKPPMAEETHHRLIEDIVHVVSRKATLAACVANAVAHLQIEAEDVS